MANNFKISTTRRNYNVDGTTTQLNAGFIKIYDGTQPANPNTAITTQNLLVSLALSATAAGAASNGSATFNAISSATISASGTATWFRMYASDGTTAVADGSVGTASADLVMNSVIFASGATCSISSATLSQP